MKQIQPFCVKARTRAVHSLRATGGGLWVGLLVLWGIEFSFDLQPALKSNQFNY